MQLDDFWRVGTAAHESVNSNTAARWAFDRWLNPPRIELYDLQRDPWEFENLAHRPEHQATVNRLLHELENWRRETADPLLEPAGLSEAIRFHEKFIEDYRARDLPEFVDKQLRKKP